MCWLLLASYSGVSRARIPAQSLARSLVPSLARCALADRLTTIRNSEQIAVVNRGVIVESGTWDELMATPNGLFASLAARQEEAAKEDEQVRRRLQSLPPLTEAAACMCRPSGLAPRRHAPLRSIGGVPLRLWRA